MPRQGHKHNVLHQREEVPQNRFIDITYGRVVCDVQKGRPEKTGQGQQSEERKINIQATATNPQLIYSQ